MNNKNQPQNQQQNKEFHICRDCIHFVVRSVKTSYCYYDKQYSTRRYRPKNSTACDNFTSKNR